MDGVRPSTGHEESSGFNNRVDCSTRSAEGIVVDGTREGFVTIRGAKTYASTHHGAQQGEAARRSSDMRQARHLPQRWYWGIVVQVWISVILVVLAMCPILYILAYLSRHLLDTVQSTQNNLTLNDCIWFVYSCLMKQGFNRTTPFNPVRMTMAAWWLTCMLLTGFYTANLTAFMTTVSPIMHPTIEQFILSNKKWMFRKGTAFSEDLLKSCWTKPNNCNAVCDRWMQKGTTDRRCQTHPSQCSTSLSTRTIRRRLQQSGLSARRPLLVLPLTQNHRRLCRQWCDERRMWMAEWNEVVFTDVSHASVYNTTMVGFESGYTVERGC
ncbi:glutamate receptor ionotropic, delta-1 [Trichonephila clavipes]|nr:glutamate receptor ionotropic, delta-1 [Trichonephila clavipes]